MTVATNGSPQGSSGIHLQNCDSFEPLRLLTISNFWFPNKSAIPMEPFRSPESRKVETASVEGDSYCVDMFDRRLSS